MRILYVAQNYQPMNASSITTYGIIKRLSEKGHEITLLVPKRCPEEWLLNAFLWCKDDINIVFVRTPSFVPYYVLNAHRRMRTLVLSLSHLFLVLQGLKIGRENKFGLIVSQHHSSHFASLSAFILSLAFKLPLVIKTHDIYDVPSGLLESLYLRMLDNIYRIALRRADRVFVVSKPLRTKVVETHKLKEDKVFVFSNTVDTKIFRPDISSSSLKRFLGVEHKKVILFIGGITKDRGLALLIKTLPRIATKNSNIIVLIVGVGPQKSELKKLAHELNVEKFVRFIQPVGHDEIPNYIGMADVTVGPLVARIDTLGSVPRKVLEYMACAKPVVACSGGISQDLIIDGVNGFLIRPGNIDELGSIILKIFDNPSLGKEVGSSARKFVENHYDWERVTDEFEMALRRISR